MYTPTKLTATEQSRVPTPNYTPLLWGELELAMSAPSGQRPRTYGYLEDTGEIVAIRSPYDVERFTGRLSFAWLSHNTIADIIKLKG